MPKVFKCPVHGYISIPNEYCSAFVDTAVFQRLRYIEQTGMRVLYPSAHHDRFVHSLGVFHLGQLAFSHLLDNGSEVFGKQDIEETAIERLRNSFLIACLLHDCGHAPFSHTFEGHYATNNRLATQIRGTIDDEPFLKDYDQSPCRPSPHEEASVIILWKHYREQIANCGADPVLAARAIVGCLHVSPSNPQERLENALIQLLNNPAIDVDKLDYIIRDTWNSGVSNVSIDVTRLLSSLTYSMDKHGKPRLAFKKQALSVLQNVVEGRNYLHRWIYSHHKVNYFQALLNKAVRQLAEKLSPKDSSSFLESLFSVDAILEPREVAGLTIYLPTDGDVCYYLKKHYKDIDSVHRLFSRNHHKSLWKSYVEWRQIFGEISSAEREATRSKALEVVCQVCGETDVIVADVEPKLAIKTDHMYVEFAGTCIPYTTVFDRNDSGSESISKFYYVYAPEAALQEKQRIIDRLIKAC